MLYDHAIDEELGQMDIDAEASLKALEVSEIQVPLRSLMRSCITIDIAASTQDAIDLLIEHHIGAASVVEDDVLRGIFGERDVLRKILNKQIGDLTQIPVTQYMKVDPITASPDDMLDTAVMYMANGGFRHLPIINENQHPIGMVSIRDVISYLVDFFPQEVLTLPPNPVRDALKAREGA
ncbi:MAG: CBS domain-containing protein [Candidatus Poribacteria bacterium]|nr:CBS domain-containing protein [Candidatus Poribacteria bacterium]